MALSLMIASAHAEVFPVPTFRDHAIPTPSVPDVDGYVLPIIDIAILVAALSLASYFTLVLRSRRYLLLLTLASLAYFGFYRQGCVCPIGATQNVALGFADANYVVPVTTVAFFTLPLIFTLIFGRTFCGSVCPLGAMQELVAIRSMTLPRWLEHSLGLVAYIYLGAAVIFAATRTGFLICRYDPFVSFFRMDGNNGLLVWGSIMMALAMVVGRPYCRFLCPYGAILRVLGAVSKYKLSIPPDTCINCQLCEDVCPYGAIHPPTSEQESESRKRGKLQLKWSLVLAPLIIALFGALGWFASISLANFHPTVRLANQLQLEELGVTEDYTEESEAFRNTGVPIAEQQDAADKIHHQFRTLGIWLGLWTGLVLATKIVYISVRIPRYDYQADRSGCVSCGRCYWYCPVEKQRLGLIDDVSELVQIDGAPRGTLPSSKPANAPQETSA